MFSFYFAYIKRFTKPVAQKETRLVEAGYYILF